MIAFFSFSFIILACFWKFLFFRYSVNIFALSGLRIAYPFGCFIFSWVGNLQIADVVIFTLECSFDELTLGQAIKLFRHLFWKIIVELHPSNTWSFSRCSEALLGSKANLLYQSHSQKKYWTRISWFVLLPNVMSTYCLRLRFFSQVFFCLRIVLCGIISTFGAAVSSIEVELLVFLFPVLHWKYCCCGISYINKFIDEVNRFSLPSLRLLPLLFSPCGNLAQLLSHSRFKNQNQLVSSKLLSEVVCETSQVSLKN